MKRLLLTGFLMVIISCSKDVNQKSPDFSSDVTEEYLM